MSKKDQAAPRNRGQFRPGVSGNPAGRPPRTRTDAADATPERALADMRNVPLPASAVARATGLTRRAPAVRRDGWINASSGHGTARDRRTLTQYGVDIVTDIEAQQLRRSEFLAAAIIEQGPELALRHPWHLKCEDKELDVAICKQAEALELDRALYDAWTQANTSGGAAIFPVLSGALGDLSQPLDEGAIASVDAFHVFEPQELTPAAYYNDIRHPKFRRPAAYRLTPLNSGRGGYVGTQVIHETRLVIFPGIRVSMQTMPGQREGWGDSILCRPRQVIADFGLAWGSAATLLHGHGKETLEMDGFAEMMGQADGLTEFDNHIAAMQMAWSTLRMGVIDAKSRVSRATGTLGGVAETLNEFKVLMAAAARRPVSILMGQSQSGLRTGDEDTQTWHSIVQGDRSVVLKPRHEQILRLMLLATAGPARGKEPEAWSVEYAPLSSPSEKEIAETRKIHMETAQIAIDAGVASSDDVAESFYKGDTYSGDIKIDWQRREAQAELEAEDMDDEDADALDPDDGGDEDDLTEDERAEIDELEHEFGADDESEDEPGGEDDREDSYEIRIDKGAGRRTAAGKGYNPNRDRTGKFASGVRKAERQVEKARSGVGSAAAKLKAARADRKAALAEARSSLKAAKQAAAKARKDPSPENKKAARAATTAAKRAAAKATRSEAAVVKQTEKHAAAKAKQTEARGALKEAKAGARPGAAKKPKPDDDEQHALSAPARGAAESAARGDYSGVTRHVESRLDAMGLQRSGNEPGRGVVNIRSVQDMPAAGGYRHWTGDITLRADTAADLQRFGQELGGRKVSHLENRAAALEKERETLWAKRVQTRDEKKKQEYRQQYSVVADQQTALRTRLSTVDDATYGMSAHVHEVLHGYSPGTANSYRKRGAQIEEITTEVSARVVMNDMFGVRITPPDKGAYFKEINAATNAISEITGKDRSSAYRDLQGVALQYKKRTGGSLRSDDDVAIAFGRDIAQVTGASMTRIEPILRRHLEAVAE